MNETPIFTKFDADRILRRAAELDGADESRLLTVDELRSIADEVGLGTGALERAIAEAQSAGFPGTRRPPVQKWGLVKTHLSTLREIPVEVDSDQLMKVVRLFQPYRDGPAQVELDEHQITWRDSRGLRFGVTSAGGMTEIRVHLDKYVLRKGRWMGWVKAAADRLELLLVMVSGHGGRARVGRMSGAPAVSDGSRS